MAVPLLDLKAQYARIKPEIDEAVAEVFAAQQFIGGPQVSALEEELAAYTGARRAVALASGTDALLLALRALDLVPGDEVVTSPFTFFATAGAIHNAGGRPVFVDIDPKTYNLDAARLADAMTERTRAIVPVHLFGQCAAMAPIMEIARERQTPVVEDAAQALGASQDGRKACALGDASAVSFFPSKNLGGAGDGGMAFTNDDAWAEKLRLHRNHGQGGTYDHRLVGTNSRLDAIQAAVLRVKLRHLDEWSDERRAHARRYRELLGGLAGVETPEEAPGNRHVYNQFTLRVPQRDRVLARLRERGVGCNVYYPIPLHLQECFRFLGYGPGDFPEAERACREVVSLPVFPELTQEQQDEVVRALSEIVEEEAK